MKFSRTLSLACVGTLAAAGLAWAPAAIAPATAATTVRVTPNPAYASDPFQGWGTSLVWFANATGGYPEDVRQSLFDAVFGEDGLNLNIARYNIGGGNATDVPPYLRPGGAVDGWWNPDLPVSDAEGPITSTYADRARYESAWNPDDPTHYDWDADPTQRWWIDALKDRITRWEAFSNSPPYFLTESGYVSGGINNPWTEQLATDDMADFAGYLVNVVEHLEEAHGIDFATLDPFNEPNTNYWSTSIPSGSTWPTSASRQEGARIGPARQDQMIAALADRLASASTTTDVKISAMDETNPSTFVTDWEGWSQSSKDAVDQLNVHTYGTSDRLRVRDIAKASDKPLWMSEVEGDWDGTGFNLTNINNGLGMAGRIVDDLRELEPTAWVFWQPVEDLYNMQRVENLNWGSVFIDFDCNADGDSLRRIAAGEADPSCKVLTNAKYNTVRNFTHYIRPGDRLIPSGNTQTTAAITQAGDGATLVHVNTDNTERVVELDLSGFADIAPNATVTPVITTASPASDVTANALVEGTAVAVDATNRTATITVPAKSVTTLLVSGVSGVSDAAPVLEDGQTYQFIGAGSGKALDATGGSGPLHIRDAAGGGAAQAWTVHTLSGAGTDRHRIALQDGLGRFLGANGTNVAIRDVDLATASNDPSLQWVASTEDGKSFSLLNVTAERVLDVGGNSTAEGASVGLWMSNYNGGQRWVPRSTHIESVAPVSLATAPGVAPTLPATVVVRYQGGVERSAPVTWSTSGIDWSTSTTVPGSGTDAFGATFETTANVEVGEFRTAQPVSLTAYAGTSLAAVQSAAPTTVPAEVTASGSAYPTIVTWDWSGLSDADLAAPGVVRVPGQAQALAAGGLTLDADLFVILTAPSERNVAPGSTASATFTEPGYNVNNTKNLVFTDKAWSNWRSGSQRTSDTLTYVLGQQEPVDRVVAHFYRDGSSLSWPQSIVVQYRTAGGSWQSTASIPVPAPSSGAPVVEVPLGGAPAKEVRIVMTARSNTHMIVSEVEIYASTPSTSGIADLARLTVDGEPLPSFDPAQTEYQLTIAGPGWPTIAAIPTDRDATVAVTQPSDADGHGSIVVTAPDGTTRTYLVTIVRPVVDAALHSWAAVHGRTVSLTAVPDATGIEYALGDGEWVAYSGPVTLSGTASETVQYRAVAGNTTTGPVSTITVAAQGADAAVAIEALGTARTVTVDEPVGGLGARVVDARGAGVAGVEVTFTVSGGAFVGGEPTAIATSNAAGIAAAPAVSSTVPGSILVTATAAGHEATSPAVTVVAPAVALDADVTVTPQTVSGKVVFAISVTNTGTETATVKVKTRFGTKTFVDVAVGTTAAADLKTGVVATPAGTATITLTGVSGAATLTHDYAAH